jgi:cysteine-rich repeat protein
MVMAKRHLVLGPLLLATGVFGCSRTGLKLAAEAGAGGNSSQSPFADAALGPDLAPLSSPDLAPDLRNANCGNGWVDPGEECDDGNTLPGDGCDSICRVECDWSPCPGPPYTRPVVCGDGVVGSGEECDDGNTNRGDGCSDVCKVELGFHCIVPGRRCTPICGDGLVVGTETCDDGNQANGDGCSEFCLTEPCWTCNGGVCQPRPPVVDGGNCMGLPVPPYAYCGNDKLDGAEECDEGPANSDSNYPGCSTHCRYLRCGDGFVNGPEECDQGFAKNTAVYGDPDGCTANCTRPHYCGDGYVDAEYGETCDNGALNGQSLCTQTCRIYLP